MCITIQSIYELHRRYNLAVIKNTYPNMAIFYVSQLILISVWSSCAAGKIGMPEKEAALEFAHKWVSNPKLYLGIVLPNTNLYNFSDMVKLIHKINAGHKRRLSYFMVNSNVTKYNTIPHTQNELIWYPFNIENYKMDCLFLDSSRFDRLYKKHFLFYDKNDPEQTFSFESCKVRFDSRLVVYRKKPNTTETVVQFEEIYKIDENETNLQKNSLGDIAHGKTQMLFTGTNSFIWNRRRPLNGKVFKAVSQNGAFIGIKVNQRKDAQGNIIAQHSGYFADVMKHLMRTLNFSLDTTVLNISSNEIVEEVGSGRYDIIYMGKGFTQSRFKSVDFSLELLVPRLGLFFAKGKKKLDMSTFLQPFRSFTWTSMIIYFVILVSCFIIVGIIVDDSTFRLLPDKVFDMLQKGLDFALRSLVAMGQSSKPMICSYKIAFLVLVVFGFIVFTMYQAALVAFLTTEEDKPPLRNLKELLNSDYNLAIRAGGTMESIFSNSAPQSDEYQLNEKGKIERFQGTDNIMRLVDSMVEIDAQSSNTILFFTYETIKKNVHYPCKLSLIKGSIRRSSPVGFMFQKNWPWKDFFNYHLLVMKESGLLERLYQRTMEREKASCPNEYTVTQTLREPQPVGTNKTFSLYLILWLGFAISLMLVLFENLNVKLRRVMLH